MVQKHAKTRCCTDGVRKRQHFLTEYVISSSRRPVLPKRKRMKEKFCREECYPHGGPSYSYNCVFLVPQSLPPTLAFVLTRLKNSVLINFVEYMEEWNFKLKMLGDLLEMNSSSWKIKLYFSGYHLSEGRNK